MTFTLTTEYDDAQEKPPVPTAAPTSRIAVTRMFEKITDKLDEWSLPDTTDTIEQQVRNDPVLLKQFLDEHLREMIYSVGMALMTQQRASDQRMAEALAMIQNVVSTSTTPHGPGVSTIGDLLNARNGQIPLTQQFNWLKEPLLVARGRHIRLGVATAPDLEAAIEIEEKRIEPQRVRLVWHKLILAALTDRQQGVSQRFTSNELIQLRQAAQLEVKAQDRAAALAAAALANRKQRGALPTAKAETPS